MRYIYLPLKLNDKTDIIFFFNYYNSVRRLSFYKIKIRIYLIRVFLNLESLIRDENIIAAKIINRQKRLRTREGKKGENIYIYFIYLLSRVT
jgi:hypothetical protein